MQTGSGVGRSGKCSHLLQGAQYKYLGMGEGAGRFMGAIWQLQSREGGSLQGMSARQLKISPVRMGGGEKEKGRK